MRSYYLILEVIPVGFWLFAYYCEKRHSNYPNTSKGYPSRRIKKSRQGWEVGNQIMAQSIKSATTVMMLLNVIFFFMNVVNYGFATILNGLIITIGIISGEKQLRQCINEKGILISSPKLKPARINFLKRLKRDKNM